MEILNTKTVLALGISGAMSVSAASATTLDDSAHTFKANDSASIIAVSSPNLRVTVYDGIATLIGTADTVSEAQSAEQEIRELQGIEHVINMITVG